MEGANAPCFAGVESPVLARNLAGQDRTGCRSEQRAACDAIGLDEACPDFTASRAMCLPPAVSSALQARWALVEGLARG